MVALFSVRMTKNQPPTLHIVVPKRVAVLATQRNLIKRRLREALRGSFSTGTRSMVVTALPSIVGKSFQEIKTAVDQAMK